MFDATLIIAFYNRFEYLEMVFAALEKQTHTNFEIIIADDGSRNEIVENIKQYSQKTKLVIKHFWQEDIGFRKNKMLNEAIRNATSNYLIFIDMDCVPHPCFIQEHVSNKQNNICLTGRRVNLSEKFTRKLSPKLISNGFLENSFFTLIVDSIFGKSTDVEKGFYFRSKFLRNSLNKKKRGVLGCNFSLHKTDIENVNGFDERYEAPSIGEDSDIQFRLELNGVEIKSLNNIAVQYHLYHKMQERPQANLDLFETVKKEKIAFTPFGLKKNFTA